MNTINQIQFNNNYHQRINQNKEKKPSFGFNVLNLVTLGLQTCEQNPMIGVGLIDCTTSTIPHALIDFKTNTYAGFETLRRELSGLFINCLLPSGFVFLLAKLLNNFSLSKEYRHLNLAASWADENSLKKLAEHYKVLPQKEDSVKQYVNSVLSSLEGFNSYSKGANKWVPYKTSKDFNRAKDILSDTIINNKSAKETRKSVSEVYKMLVDDTKAAETIKFSDSKEPFNSSLQNLLRDLVDQGKKFTDPAVSKDINKYIKSAIKFVNHKSFIGLSIIIPIAMSVQYINRWITRISSGMRGAPIYKDFGNSYTAKPRVSHDDKNLNLHKAIGIASILGLSYFSIMKKPSWKMFQFKGKFPTLDQARTIATCTFASRILPAESNDEIRESTTRDLFALAGLYLLGDYVAKLTALVINKLNNKIDLINKVVDLKGEKSTFKILKNWIQNHKLKSFDEVPAHLKNYRSICQVVSLGTSMLILGFLVVFVCRKQTEKNERKRMKELNNVTNIQNQNLKLSVS